MVNGVSESDMYRVLEATACAPAQPGRAILHSLPTGFALDGAGGIRDPKGMMGDTLGADLHVVSADAAALSNLLLAVERCHLAIEAVVATPYASGLAVLVDDEAVLGATVLDIGGGSVGMGVFRDGRLVHGDAVAVGGKHITMDIARGLNTRLVDAERLKTLYGSAISSPSDERETLAVLQVGEEGEKPDPHSEIAAFAHHPAARRGNPGAGARPSQGRRFPRDLGRTHRPDRRQRASSPACRKRRAESLAARSASGVRSASRACRNRRRAPAFRRRSAFWSIRNSPASNISSRAAPGRGSSGGRRAISAGSADG